ncbi:hypothetical protein ABW19_dt0204273 [Dactylella cylindrospora]|nr:hypothetical protein ABW19_dt0204273 [Dactylella cylindrospora]
MGGNPIALIFLSLSSAWSFALLLYSFLINVGIGISNLRISDHPCVLPFFFSPSPFVVAAVPFVRPVAVVPFVRSAEAVGVGGASAAAVFFGIHDSGLIKLLKSGYLGTCCCDGLLYPV